jgi:hypothetical protein
VGLQEILDKGNKGKSGVAGDADAELNEVLTSQVRVISLHFKQLASMLDVVVRIRECLLLPLRFSRTSCNVPVIPYFNAPASLAVVNSKTRNASRVQYCIRFDVVAMLIGICVFQWSEGKIIPCSLFLFLIRNIRENNYARS